MNYDFGENAQAGQEKVQRMMAEADEWRQARTQSPQAPLRALGRWRPAFHSLISWWRHKPGLRLRTDHR